MMKDLFTCYHSKLPKSVQDNFDEDEVWALNSGDNSFDDLFGDCGRLNFEDFFSFAKNRVVFITPDTAISVFCDSPSHHKYTIDMTCVFSASTNIERTLEISGVDAQATSPALDFLLRFLLQSYSNDEEANTTNRKNGVILKCFPTTPRQPLGSLDLSPPKSNGNRKRKLSSSSNHSCEDLEHKHKIDIEFRFFSLKKSHCEAIFGGTPSVVSCVKFSQCEVDEWAMFDENDQDQSSDNDNNDAITTTVQDVGPKKFVLSCTQREFRKFSEGGMLMSNRIAIRDVHLVLHFMMADLDVEHLICTLENNRSLEHLTIEYLAMDDKTWTRICKVLYNHPRLTFLELAYTEKFADSCRRLTPERRRSRTNDMLGLLKTNKAIQEVHWPKFQQDETLIADLERVLMENKRHSSASTEADSTDYVVKKKN